MQNNKKIKHFLKGQMTLSLRGTYFKVKVALISGLSEQSVFWTDVLGKEYNLRQSDLESGDTPTIHVDRNPMVFHFILDYLSQGSLHFPHSICTDVIVSELWFWGIEVSELSPCCYVRILKAEENRQTTETVKQKWLNLNTKGVVPEHAQTKKDRLSRLRVKLFYFCNDPDSSKAAKVWAVVAILVVLLSITVLMIQTLHSLRTPDFETVASITNLSEGEGLYKYYMDKTERHHWLAVLDTPCTIILSAEYVIRFIISYGKWKFFINPMNIIDLLGVLPNWVQLFLEIVLIVLNDLPEFLQYIAVAMSFFSLLRMLRIFKIMMLNKKLRILFLAMSRSVQELCILASLIVVFAAMFGSLGFYIELDKDTFPNIFYAVWWAIITMTTVGYGDFYPKSTFGYVLGVLCSLCGIIVIAVATTVIVNHVLMTHSAVENYERSLRKLNDTSVAVMDVKLIVKENNKKEDRYSNKVQPVDVEQNQNETS